MKDRDLKSYVEKAMKKVQRETEKGRGDERGKSERELLGIHSES